MVALFIVDFSKKPISLGYEISIRKIIISVIILIPLIIPVKYGVSLMLHSSLSPRSLDHFSRVKDEMKLALDNDDIVMANQVYWLGLSDHVYYSWHELAFYKRYKPGSSIEEAILEYKPDIFILDGHIDILTSDDDNPNLYQKYFGLPKSELYSLLDEKARLIKVIDDEVYGSIRIFRFNWSD
jgi:hypothetical protein